MESSLYGQIRAWKHDQSICYTSRVQQISVREKQMYLIFLVPFGIDVFVSS